MLLLTCMYFCKVTVGILVSRIKFNCILKCTSNAIMMRDDGNTLHSCLINSCCALKVDDINLSLLLFFPCFFCRVFCTWGQQFWYHFPQGLNLAQTFASSSPSVWGVVLVVILSKLLVLSLLLLRGYLIPKSFISWAISWWSEI